MGAERTYKAVVNDRGFTYTCLETCAGPPKDGPQRPRPLATARLQVTGTAP